jgi:hypothetical protein
VKSGAEERSIRRNLRLGVSPRCHEITKLLEEWRDGDESALEELMGMSFKRAHSPPLATHHSLIVWSKLPLANVFPSELNGTDTTSAECPLSVRNSHPVIPSIEILLLLTAWSALSACTPAAS